MRATIRGRAGSDWDLAVFGTGGRFVAAAAEPTSDDLAAGFAVAGEPLTIQACLVRGKGSRAGVNVSNFAADLSGGRAILQILSVHTPTRADRNKVEELGLDDAHSFTEDTIDIVASGAEIDPERQVASSASADAVETIVYSYPKPGVYTLEIRNYSAVQPVAGSVQIFGEQPGSFVTVKAHTGTWTLTCEIGGRVVSKRDVLVGRGEKRDLGDVCEPPASNSSGLALSVSVKNAKKLRLSSVLRSGLLSSVRCSARCSLTASLQLDRGTARKLRLKTTVAKTPKALKFTGKRRLRLKLTKSARGKLRRSRTVNAKLVVVARGALGTVRSRTVAVRLRR